MPDKPPTASTNRDFTAEIVLPMSPNQRTNLHPSTVIGSRGLSKSVGEAIVERTPAVPIRRSFIGITYLPRFGWKGQTLRPLREQSRADRPSNIEPGGTSRPTTQ